MTAYLAAVYHCPGSQAQHYFRVDADAAALLDDLNRTLYATDTATPATAAAANLPAVDSIDILLLAKRARNSGDRHTKRVLPPLYG